MKSTIVLSVVFVAFASMPAMASNSGASTNPCAGFQKDLTTAQAQLNKDKADMASLQKTIQLDEYNLNNNKSISDKQAHALEAEVTKDQAAEKADQIKVAEDEETIVKIKDNMKKNNCSS